jgi:hypothetical protein
MRTRKVGLAAAAIEDRPPDQAQRSFTDPESEPQKTSDGLIPGYNAQVAVDAQSQLIVVTPVSTRLDVDLRRRPGRPRKQHLRPARKTASTSACGGWQRVGNTEERASARSP